MTPLQLLMAPLLLPTASSQTCAGAPPANDGGHAVIAGILGPDTAPLQLLMAPLLPLTASSQTSAGTPPATDGDPAVISVSPNQIRRLPQLRMAPLLPLTTYFKPVLAPLQLLRASLLSLPVSPYQVNISVQLLMVSSQTSAGAPPATDGAPAVSLSVSSDRIRRPSSY